MKYKTRFFARIIVFAVMLISANAFAIDTGWTKISILHPYLNGLNVKVVNNNNDPSGCGGGNGGFMLLSPTHPEYKLLSSILMLAFSTNKDVLVYTYSSAEQCISGGSVVLGAQIK